MNNKIPTLTLTNEGIIFVISDSNQVEIDSRGIRNYSYSIAVVNGKGGEEFNIDRLSKQSLKTLGQAIELYLDLID